VAAKLMQSFVMLPAAGQHLVRHVSDTLRFSVGFHPEARPDRGWHARLRTTIGRAAAFRTDIIRAHTARVPPFGASWHDLPLLWDGERWSGEILLTEVGHFAAKPYLLDAQGHRHWPPGHDIRISVHPDWCRSGNLIYCAFVRLFGKTRSARQLLPESLEPYCVELQRQGYAVLPPSGTMRDLIRQLPHIVGRLGCRILHLLPVHPVPTTFGRFGRLGSPYAALDLTAVDPGLVEFDKRTNGVDQFCELTRSAHHHGARVFLDIVINHTGWGSRLFEEHPEFFRREPDGRFASPGAWGVIWEDLVELEQRDVALWDRIAQALLTWCRRGVDGFRCDAGYKIPTHVWQYITARVRVEFPDTVFLLEGLGGSWDATEALLTDGGMQWAYSELFQNYTAIEIQNYLDYAVPASERVGTYVHYSETHDNDRLAARGRAWSLLRNRLCALTSVRGAFGFTCGVEWLASEKIRVHERTGMAWDAPDNIVSELSSLNRLLANHPAFFDGATLRRLSPIGSPVFALERNSANGEWQVLVLINTSADHPQDIEFDASALTSLIPLVSAPVPAVGKPAAPDPVSGTTTAVALRDLLGQPPPRLLLKADQTLVVTLPPAGAFCLSAQPAPPDGFGETQRQRWAQVAWAVQQVAVRFPGEQVFVTGHREALADAVHADAERWLATLSALPAHTMPDPSGILNIGEALAFARQTTVFPNVISWSAADARRITLVPPGWWLIIHDPGGFRAKLTPAGGCTCEHAFAIKVAGGYVACFPPREPAESHEATLVLERFASEQPLVEAVFRYLAAGPSAPLASDPDGLVLLTNGRGAMARLRVDFGSIQSKYDCALGANLHPGVPVDRHVFVKRVRAWVNADGFFSPLHRHNLVELHHGPPACWHFSPNAGDGRKVRVSLEASMPAGRNTTIMRFTRSDRDSHISVALTLRVDLEDRSYHAETHRDPGADHHFSFHTRALRDTIGFEFTPAHDRCLTVFVDRGVYHPEPEWSQGIPHPFEAARGQAGAGDAFSPGWFEIPLSPGEAVTLCLDAEFGAPPQGVMQHWLDSAPLTAPGPDELPASKRFHRELLRSASAFVVRRDAGHTVIAGYPWFLDWGRDTLIAARGLLGAGWHREVLGMLDVFGRFADRGTLPNSIFGENASNRDTSDAQLWYAVAVEEANRLLGDGILGSKVDESGRTRLDVVRQLVEGYLAGTPNGIHVDPESALVWSPSHFTWMDTNHPAGTPREGYPVEIQALWIRAIRFLARADGPSGSRWDELSRTAEESFESLFWLEKEGWYSDVLLAGPGIPARRATAHNALRCNVLIAIAFGLVPLDRGRRCVHAALRHLLVPGAIRSLAPLPVSPPLPVRAHDGRLLNDPEQPYWGRYEGDEDTRRKPAYHNGTAWTWFLPIFCEALLKAWNSQPRAVRAADAILGSLDQLLYRGCHGHLPEVLDGDAPHFPRGCDAQAWSVTEALRVARLIDELKGSADGSSAS
jgi:predicted glycogen debranching enzyme